MSDVAVQVLKRVLVPVALLFGVMVAIGLLITKVMLHMGPLTVEDSVNRELERDRTAEGNAVSLFFSTVGSTPVIIAVTALAALILRLTLKRWREPLFLCAAVTAQAIVFFLTTLLIDRQRPKVDHLDSSPPTSSFPSGHTSAAVALYLGLAVVLARLTNRTALRAACWLLLLVPLGVAVGRMYRGMHHPTDVTASFLNGGVCVWVMTRAFLDEKVLRRRPSSLHSRSAAARV